MRFADYLFRCQIDGFSNKVWARRIVTAGCCERLTRPARQGHNGQYGDPRDQATPTQPQRFAYGVVVLRWVGVELQGGQADA